MVEWLFEAIYDFTTSNRSMYRYAKRKHDDTHVVRKVSKQPYWVHPEGVAKMVMDYGADDATIKAAMAHDLMEDAGADYDDIVEKFGKEVADIVQEVTSDKHEIDKVGKEKYISDELMRLSPKALIVKLADILYNINDAPTTEAYDRMKRNVWHLMKNKDLSGIALKLADEIIVS